MTARLIRFALLALLLACASTPAFAQGSSTSSLSGSVVDADGGAIPGATVIVKNNATGVSIEAVSNSTGQFSFPGLTAGTYTVTVSLTGFKTYVANDVRLLASRPGEITARLEIGALSETIEVKASSELIQTQSSTVSSTLSTEQLTELPLVSRNALYALTTLPGVSSTGGPRNALINGLPNNTVNITIDGVGTGNQLQSTDGFFSMVTPRMDAVEEVTVTGAVPGVGAGAGSVQIAFVTRSGSNQFDTSGYFYWKDERFNSNYFFNEIANLPKNEVKLYNYGGRVGGPIVLPGFDGRGKAFFFFNMEVQLTPTSITRTRTILKDSAAAGIFTYDRTIGGVTTQQTVDLLQLAAANGQLATTDPTVMALIARIKAATATTGVISETNNRNVNEYRFQAAGTFNQYAPTGRIDYNLTDKHRITATYYWQRFKSNPDLLNNTEVRFPGFANYGQQNSYRTTGSLGVRSTLTSNMVNEFKGGWQWSPNDFFSNVTPDMFADQGGYSLGIPQNGNTALITGATSRSNSAPRNTTTWSVSDNLSWLKGSHSFTLGGAFSGVHNRLNSYDAVPIVNIGFNTTFDPAASLFSSASGGAFPGATSGNLTDARNLYALLTGRIASINGTARLDASTGKYVYLGDLAQKAKQYSMAAYASDSWRVSPTLTLNAGVRWDLQLPFTAVTPTFSTSTMEDLCGISGLGSGPDGRACNLFQPGTLTGKAQPAYQLYGPGSKTFNTNYTNFGYNAGIAWRPNVQDGFLRTILGSPEQATVRAGYSMTYNVERFDRFTGSVGSNPGGTLSANRNATTGFCLVCPGESWPILYSQKNRLGAPAFPEAPVYPLLATTAQSIQIFQADLRTPRVHSYSVGFQRSIGDDMALEVRYVGNRNKYGWAEENWNERVIFENGFYDEFLLARANLAANIAAGKGNTFAYTGVAGTSPLPIHQAYLSGRSGADVTNPARYTASQYRNSAFYSRFSVFEPEVADAAEALDTTAFRANALAAGLPVNFWAMNPAAGGARVVVDREGTRYNSLQVELRRRLSKGLLVSTNYTYGIRKGLTNRSIRLDRMEVDSTGVPHEFKGNFTYEVPVGRGRRFGTDMNPILNGILGNWEFSGNARVQTSRFRLTNVKLVGMTADELSREFKIRIYKDAATGTTTVWSMPQDIIDNTRRAFSSDPTTATGYSTALGVPTGRYIKPSSDANCIAIYRGDCNAPDININGPLFTRVDLRIKKQFLFLSRGSIELNLEMLNALDNINFNHQLDPNPNTSSDTFRVQSGYRDQNTTNDQGGRIGQIVFRINW
ncbi:MAG: TonB-dependent receptor [Acidobacteria bacterium]|nr:TonB-dependent receptor [Acidobacteriota bacterium]